MTAWAALGAVLGACTYDFDRYVTPASGGAAPSASGRAGATPSGGHAGRSAAGAGGTTGGRAGAASGARGGATGASGSDAGEGGVSTGEGGMGNVPGSGGSSGRGGTGASGAGIGGADVAGRGGSGMAGGATAGSAGSTPVDCPGGTTLGGHCYFLVGTSGGLDWLGAKAACEAQGSHLVTVTSADEQTLLATTFYPSAEDTWIGLSLADTASDPSALCKLAPADCPFSWVTDEALEYTVWAIRDGGDDEPNYTGACVRIQAADQAWADTSCTSTYRAICEKDG